VATLRDLAGEDSRVSDDGQQAPEVVGLFADRSSFQQALAALFAAGFERPSLSVLASHESLDAADPPERSWRDALVGLVGELKYEGPLVASGAILLAGGATAALLAGVIGAAVGGLALKELLEDVIAKPHRADFGRSLAAGSIILWVRAEGEDIQALAQRILEGNGGTNVHLVSGADAAEDRRHGDTGLTARH
jgi:hypothetical protein